MSIRFAAPLALAFSAALAAGCAGSPASVAAPAPPPPERIDDPSAIGYTSEVGGLPEEAMQDAFASLGKDVEHCISSGFSRLESLGGHVELGLKIDTGGHATAVFVRASALGDRETEKCIVDAAKSRAWPHAVGGEGVAQTAYDATPAKDPAVWDAKKVRAVIEQVRASTARCRRGVGGAFVVTAYVRPDGRVESAGLAMSTPEADQAADCIVDQVRKTRFGYPGRSSKLSFDL